MAIMKIQTHKTNRDWYIESISTHYDDFNSDITEIDVKFKFFKVPDINTTQELEEFFDGSFKTKNKVFSKQEIQKALEEMYPEYFI